MPWVKLDDRFPSHRKVALLSDRAFRLHVSAICWCAENLTDGRISDRELALVAHIRGLKPTAKQLEEAGLWDRTEGGWAIHDYLDYNPSRDQVLAERKKNAARQEAFRKRRNGKPTPPPNGSSNARSNGVTRDDEMHDDDTTATRTQHDDDTTATSECAVSEEELQVTAIRNGVTNGAPTRPDPTTNTDTADVGRESAGRVAREAAPDGDAPIDIDGFSLGDGLRRWAHRDGYAGLVDLDYETAQFVSHFRANGQHRRNWNDEWQKWIRRAHKWAVDRGQRALPIAGADNVVQMRPSTADQRVATGQALAAMFREQEQHELESTPPANQEPA